MAQLLPADFLGRQIYPVGGRQAVPVSATGLQSIMTTPGFSSVAVGGIGRTCILFVFVNNFTGVAPTASFGSSQSVVDWIAATAIVASPAGTTLYATAALASFYAAGVLFQMNVTVAGTGFMDIACFGWQE